VLACNTVITQAADPLPFWNNTPPKKTTVSFVETVTKAGSPEYVPGPERIAVFDNDGALWRGQPMGFRSLLPRQTT